MMIGRALIFLAVYVSFSGVADAQVSDRGACIQSGIPVRDPDGRNWSLCFYDAARNAYGTLAGLFDVLQSSRGSSVSGADMTCWTRGNGFYGCVVAHLYRSRNAAVGYANARNACIQSGIPARARSGDYWSFCYDYGNSGPAQTIYTNLVKRLDVHVQRSRNGSSVAAADMGCWTGYYFLNPWYACVVPYPHR
jgi:hypothetical protein